MWFHFFWALVLLFFIAVCFVGWPLGSLQKNDSCLMQSCSLLSCVYCMLSPRLQTKPLPFDFSLPWLPCKEITLGILKLCGEKERWPEQSGLIRVHSGKLTHFCCELEEMVPNESNMQGIAALKRIHLWLMVGIFRWITRKLWSLYLDTHPLILI